MSYASSANTFLRLLQPSWYGGLFAVILGVAVTAALIIPSFYEGSLVELYFNTAKSSETGFFSDYSRLSHMVESSDIAGDAAVFLVWALVGLAAYYMVLSAVGAASNTVQFIQLIEYFKAERKRLEVEALIRLLVRLSAIAGLYVVYRLFVSVIFPYTLIFAHKALIVSPLFGVLYLIIACLLIMLTVHVTIVLVRLMLLKPRVFKSSDDPAYL